jgi:hypothetical protein
MAIDFTLTAEQCQLQLATSEIARKTLAGVAEQVRRLTTSYPRQPWHRVPG